MISSSPQHKLLIVYRYVRYEESQLHKHIYQLHVKLLGADKSTVISEHTVNPTEDCSAYSHTWKEVSYRFPWQMQKKYSNPLVK